MKIIRQPSRPRRFAKEIVDDLEAGLEKFREIAGDVAPKEDEFNTRD